ncbi:AraC family ligand binding domain-containing protein [Paenibacillus provencensis]|uniref:AraC family ligand binding domain-containing protein n=1 Tax=Paenibacillus provencensis TaxID=441151 RepID=A0ABW3Q2C1_9BACL|nr:AraC family ligand binding domain-containing protein [Paenibacillus sp. MER 78]MCM3127069.1 AraC family ligand binding domain-containing protein [Paenibacillus sp. MER 78]
MEQFIYKKSAGLTVLSANMTEFKYKKHAHEEYAIGVTLRGIQHYHLDGSLQLSHPNGVMFFNPEQAHDGMAHDHSGLEYVMLYVEPSLFLQAAQRKDIVRFSTPIMYDRMLKQQILNLSYNVLNEKDEAQSNELFLSLTDRLFQVDSIANAKKDTKLITTAKEMIRANLDQVLMLDDICKELGCSKFQFIRMFKAHTGISPYQYFLNCKVERAKHIIEINKDIYLAVAACGFVDLTHLNRHFKSVYGLTAFEYMTHMDG